ncbi:TPA: hypothetical protein ACITN2_004706 [Salmonella enterica subsp. enterica serovar Virchow]
MRRNIVHVLTEQARTTRNPHIFELAKMLCAMQRQQAQEARKAAH